MASRPLVIEIPRDELAATDDSNEAPRPKKAETTETRTSDSAFDDLRSQVSKLTQDRDASRRANEDETRRRLDAEARERRAREAEEAARKDAETARAEGREAQVTTLETAITAQKAALDAAENEFASAGEAGDFKRQAKAQRAMSEAAAELKLLESGKSALASSRGAEETHTGRVRARDDDNNRAPPRKDASEDPVEKYIGQFTPRSQDWLRKHVECVTDREKNAAVIRAHHVAIDNGLKQDSDEYFDFIDQKMGYAERRGSDDDEPVVVRDRSTTRRRSDDDIVDRDEDTRMNGNRMRSAPARGTGGGDVDFVRVTLTPEQVKQATDGTIVWNTGDKKGEPIGTTEYARRLAIMKKEGRLETPYAS